MSSPALVYKFEEVQVPKLGSFRIHYTESGPADAPVLLLLHGFPSDSSQYHDFIPYFTKKYRVLAPDYPGFGFTTAPAGMEYTFENLTLAIEAWVVALKLESFAMYIFDYGAPVGLRLALKQPQRVKVLIAQNGNAYEEGLGKEFFAPRWKFWQSGNDPNMREMIRKSALTLEGMRQHWYMGMPEQDLKLINPISFTSAYLLNIAGKEKEDRMIDLNYDYRTNVEMYPKFHEFFRASKIPFLAAWGRDDPAFVWQGAEAYKKDFPDAEIHYVEAGHFALETKGKEIAEICLRWLEKVGY